MDVEVQGFSGNAKYTMYLWFRSMQIDESAESLSLYTLKVKLILGFVWHNYKILDWARTKSVCKE